MLDQLINLVKEHAGDAIVNNPAIPNQHNDAAINETANGIMQSLKGQMSGGNTEGILNLLKGGNASGNPMVGKIQEQVSSNLMNKFGLDSGAAGSIVSSLIPVVMSKFVNKTNDPNDSSFTMDGIMSSLGGSDALGSILNKAKGMFS